jgi:nucleoporin POM152
MNGTPARRGVGGFPSTPQTQQRSPGVRSPNGITPRPNVRSSLADLPKAPPQSTGPLIQSDILDPAQQRFYVFALYVALWAYRSYDFYTLIVEEDQSLWQCLKWCSIDMFFMFGVPLLEIPWLEWSNSAAFLLFVVHAAIDVMLMFKIGLPVQAWLMGIMGFLWDSELAISERSVKPGAILHNASLILGKQIINILPEGSAILNPDKQPFCLSSTISQLEIPILINQTEPVEMDLVRIDVDTNVNETIKIRGRDLRKMLDKARKTAKKSSKSLDPDDPLTLRYTIKKPGVYLLKRVVDQSKLEVRPRAASLVVATCPQARVKPTTNSRCRNDLSNMALEVEGTPPLSIKYRLTVAGEPKDLTHLQNLQPDDHTSPLSKHTSQALVKSGQEDVSWARSQTITVPLNEPVTTSGRWVYEVEEVKDGLGNLVNFAALDEDERPKSKATGIRQSFEVHERPQIHLQGCSPQSPIKIAKGGVELLPVVYSSTSKHPIDAQHVISYLFTPEHDIGTDGYHSSNAKLKTETMTTSKAKPKISEPGLYTLKSVSTGFCEGEVLEPVSCLLQNPPEPSLALASEDIVDKCAGNPIGLRVSLDLVGSPPFVVSYTEYSKGRKSMHKSLQVPTLRSTIELTPKEAGHYKYTFDRISDSVYKDIALQNVELQQNVRPTAQARFVESERPKQACIDDAVEFDVRLSGDAPWKLDYEILHNGKRKKKSIDTSDEYYTIRTDKLTSGGEYIVTLTSIIDKMDCKELLQEETRVNVRHERPKAYFGHIEGKQHINALEGRTIGLPLRFTGNGPWRLEYENLATNEVKKDKFLTANANLDVKTDGTYHLLSVKDAFCPGLIEEKSSRFDVSWVARPMLSIPDSPAVVFEGGKYVKDPVCEGDEDAFDVSLSGKFDYPIILLLVLTCFRQCTLRCDLSTGFQGQEGQERFQQERRTPRYQRYHINQGRYFPSRRV